MRIPRCSLLLPLLLASSLQATDQSQSVTTEEVRQAVAKAEREAEEERQAQRQPILSSRSFPSPARYNRELRKRARQDGFTWQELEPSSSMLDYMILFHKRSKYGPLPLATALRQPGMACPDDHYIFLSLASLGLLPLLDFTLIHPFFVAHTFCKRLHIRTQEAFSYETLYGLT